MVPGWIVVLAVMAALWGGIALGRAYEHRKIKGALYRYYLANPPGEDQ